MTTRVLSYPARRWSDLVAPSATALSRSAKVFRDRPRWAWTATTPDQLSETSVPEIAFVGRSNVGKSSLLNNLLGTQRSRLVRTSATPGYTRALHGFDVAGKDGARGRICLVDTPGYGYKSRSEWGELIMRYLTTRSTLRRTCLLIESSHGIKSSDEALIEELCARCVPFQVVLTKTDKRYRSDARDHDRLLADMDGIRNQIERYRNARTMLWSEIIAVSDTAKHSTDQLAYSLLRACDGPSCTATIGTTTTTSTCRSLSTTSTVEVA